MSFRLIERQLLILNETNNSSLSGTFCCVKCKIFLYKSFYGIKHEWIIINPRYKRQNTLQDTQVRANSAREDPTLRPRKLIRTSDKFVKCVKILFGLS